MDLFDTERAPGVRTLWHSLGLSALGGAGLLWSTEAVTLNAGGDGLVAAVFTAFALVVVYLTLVFVLVGLPALALSLWTLARIRGGGGWYLRMSSLVLVAECVALLAAAPMQSVAGCHALALLLYVVGYATATPEERRPQRWLFRFAGLQLAGFALALADRGLLAPWLLLCAMAVHAVATLAVSRFVKEWLRGYFGRELARALDPDQPPSL